MVLETKERIIAAKHFATERYIRSTHPVLYLSMRRDSGGTNIFRSDDAYGHLATVTGAIWTPKGRNFDGIGDKIIIPDADSLDMSGSITACVWQKRGTDIGTAARTLVSKRIINTNTANYQFYLTPTTLRTRYYNGVTEYEVAYTPTIGVWELLTFVVDNPNSLFILYSNAVSKGSIAANIGATNTGTFWVGFFDTAIDEPYHGDIGEVLIYNRVLSPSEILNIYLTTKFRYR